MAVVGCQHVVGHVPLVDIDVRPLSALRLVAGDGVGVLHLQGIVEPVLLEFLHALRLEAYVVVVGQHAFVELCLLFACQCGSLARQRVQQHGGGEFAVVVVGHRHGHFGKSEAVELLLPPDALHHGTVAIGYKGRGFLLPPVVVVLHNHEHIAVRQLLLAVEYCVAYALVVDVRTFVRAGDDDGVVLAYMTVAVAELLNEFVAPHQVYVGEPLEAYFRHSCAVVEQ